MSQWDLDPPSRKKKSRLSDGGFGDAQNRPGGATAGDEAGGVTPDSTVSSAGTRKTVAPMDGAIVIDDSAPGGGMPRPKKTRRRLLSSTAWGGAALVLLALGAVIGFAVSSSQNDDLSVELRRVRNELGVLERALSQAEERNWNYYRENQALKAEMEEERPGDPISSTTLPSGTVMRYGDGVYLVGEDIAPGTYEGAVIDRQGYWARLKGTDGQVSSIITNAIPRGPFVLTIMITDRAVELRGVEITPR